VFFKITTRTYIVAVSAS